MEIKSGFWGLPALRSDGSVCLRMYFPVTWQYDNRGRLVDYVLDDVAYAVVPSLVDGEDVTLQIGVELLSHEIHTGNTLDIINRVSNDAALMRLINRAGKILSEKSERTTRFRSPVGGVDDDDEEYRQFVFNRRRRRR